MIKQWPVVTLGSVTNILTGHAFKSKDFVKNGILLIRGDNVKRGHFQFGEKARYWPDVSPKLEKYLLQLDDVLVGMDGSRVGDNFACVSKEELPSLLVQRVACIRGGELLDQKFLKYLIFLNYFYLNL